MAKPTHIEIDEISSYNLSLSHHSLLISPFIFDRHQHHPHWHSDFRYQTCCNCLFSKNSQHLHLTISYLTFSYYFPSTAHWSSLYILNVEPKPYEFMYFLYFLTWMSSMIRILFAVKEVVAYSSLYGGCYR